MILSGHETGLEAKRRPSRGAVGAGALLLLAALLAIGLAVRPAAALVELNVTKGNVQPLPIAITPFLGGADAQLGANIAGVISDDLRRSGLFVPLDRTAAHLSSLR